MAFNPKGLTSLRIRVRPGIVRRMNNLLNAPGLIFGIVLLFVLSPGLSEAGCRAG